MLHEKQIPMPKEISILEQFRHENETWKRSLEFIVEENIILKNRLADILKETNNNDEGLLERLENFQNHFLKEDEIIKFLRKEISEEDKLLTQEIYVDGNLYKDIRMKQKKLRKGIEIVEQRFNKLKQEFNTYIGEIL